MTDNPEKMTKEQLIEKVAKLEQELQTQKETARKQAETIQRLSAAYSQIASSITLLLNG